MHKTNLCRHTKRSFLLKMLPKNSIGVEIGVHEGEFSEEILNVVSPRKLHLIDPWKYESSPIYQNAWYGGTLKNGQAEMDARFLTVNAKFSHEINSDIIKIHRGHSNNILTEFENEYFDWTYIDGNHLYEYVIDDLELSLLKVKSGGYITGDDYMDGGWWDGGVKKAVDEFIQSKLVQLIEIRDQQFIFRKN